MLFFWLSSIKSIIFTKFDQFKAPNHDHRNVKTMSIWSKYIHKMYLTNVETMSIWSEYIHKMYLPTHLKQKSNTIRFSATDQILSIYTHSRNTCSITMKFLWRTCVWITCIYKKIEYLMHFCFRKKHFSVPKRAACMRNFFYLVAIDFRSFLKSNGHSTFS